MDKLAFAALPLLALVLLIAGWKLLRRPLTRPMLNAWTSLLLLLYLLVTAGLGIFWVAQQQLPVFDWHYLFGYLTLLVLVLHLALNLPRALRQVRAMPPRKPPAHAAPLSPLRRRWVVAAAPLAFLGALAAAYGLGWRQGSRSSAAIRPAGAADAMAVVDRYHRLTSHGRGALGLQLPGLGTVPSFKSYDAAGSVALPPASSLQAEGPAAITTVLGSVLWHTAGITAEQGGLRLRASPSSGALFPTEWYVFSTGTPGLPAGFWHYDPRAHRLDRVRDTAPGDADLGTGGDWRLQGAPVVVLAGAVWRRSARKYGERGYRFVLADLGHALENLRQAAAAWGWHALEIARFDDLRAAAALGLDDEEEEAVLALVALHAQAPQAAASGAPVRFTARDPAAGTPRALPFTLGMHRAASLRLVSEGHDGSPRADAAAHAVASARADGTVLARIAGRRSRRRFDAAGPDFATLREVRRALGELPRPLQLHVLVHDAAGLASGVYRWNAADSPPRLIREDGEQAARSHAAALDQDVIGEAASVWVLSLPRAALVAYPDGPARGYRRALLDAGHLGERMYLAAEARALAACSVGAFYDDEMARLLGQDPADHWVLHLVALGARA